mmetsp:Transcript_130224/g.308972  ORF Transcript_130224/g.308972 Transcript_130224/m.308972 type:complete len:228 (+) Transcript_130224:708-1391(+)
MHDANLPVAQEWQKVFASLIQKLGLVQVCQSQVLHAGIICVFDGLHQHVKDRLPVRLHEVEVARHRQAPGSTLSATVVIALYAGGGQAVPAEKHPEEGQWLQGKHPPSLLVLMGSQEGRQPWQMQHGVKAMSMRQEHNVELSALLVQDLLVQGLGRRMNCATKVIPNRTEEAVVVLILAVMQGMVRGRVDKIFQRPGLCPSWHALKVAVANAVHDVEEHKVNRNQSG